MTETLNKDTDLQEKEKKKSCERCCHFMKSPSFFLLCNFLISQWGDWMWQFAAGIYLVRLYDGKLRLAAIFGFLGGGCVLLFGGIIGDWVDRNGRLKVVRISLFIQNCSVALSALCVCLVLGTSNNVDSLFALHSPGRLMMEAAIVIFAVVAQLASVAYKIAIEKDWIVEIAAGQSSFLANLNAVTRSLDLMCKIVSPLTVGLIMSYASLFVSAIVIAVCNLVFVFIEYALLLHIYRLVPKLATKNITDPVLGTEDEREMLQLNKDGFKIAAESSTKDEEDMFQLENNVKRKAADAAVDKDYKEMQEIGVADDGKKKNVSFLRRIFHPLFTLVEAWQTYRRQEILFAGVSLACLYMTVLGFDSITLGYIYTNGISEFLIGICMGLAGLMGIIGAFLFTRFNHCFGLNRTGLIAFYSEIFCLIFVVASVWMPGSLFDLSILTKPQTNVSTIFDFKIESNNSDVLLSPLVVLKENGTDVSTDTIPTDSDLYSKLNTSIIMLLVGIITSRIGLWMADLVVTQVMQESIIERERGVVNGVQNSLNMFMDMLKNLLVIILPQVQVFGIHIVLSFLFICAGGLCFTYFYCKQPKEKKSRNISMPVEIINMKENDLMVSVEKDKKENETNEKENALPTNTETDMENELTVKVID